MTMFGNPDKDGKQKPVYPIEAWVELAEEIARHFGLEKKGARMDEKGQIGESGCSHPELTAEEVDAVVKATMENVRNEKAAKAWNIYEAVLKEDYGNPALYEIAKKSFIRGYIIGWIDCQEKIESKLEDMDLPGDFVEEDFT